MAKIEVKNLEGKKIEEIELNPEIFGLEINEELVSDVFIAQHANRRTAIAHTKTVSDRAGSTAKPWAQKGTGRARTGSIRNPIWRGGGVTFGPTKNRNFSKKINKKVGISATKMVLSGKVSAKELIVVDSLKTDNNKTKEVAQALKALKIDRKALLALSADEKDTKLSSRNIKYLTNTEAQALNVFDMLNSKYLIVSKAGIEEIEKRFGKKEKKAEKTPETKKISGKKQDKDKK
ncbi:MAG: 50S ribosomal protein L4 [Patescibacteria group bacterium]|nr:50S ribosomal protein L4 [Patescibacteria group bacterium]